MLIHANKEELKKLAKCFYDVSHTLITIYDANKTLLCSYPNKLSTFCNEIRKSSHLANKCIECDNTALTMCDKTRSVYAYKCHMGLIEVAAPIICNDIIIGYVLFGQITDKRDKTNLLCNLKEVSDKYNLNLETLETGIQKIKYRSSDYIDSITKIIEMCTNYIWMNSFISIKNDSTAHGLDLYIRENLSKDLSTTVLCSQFNICRSSLYTISKEYFGCGISEYINQCRLSKAKKLLEEKLPIYQVAEQVGIPDANYFIRFFKRHTGCTPKKFQSLKDNK